jgi:hypothetical protein
VQKEKQLIIIRGGNTTKEGKREKLFYIVVDLGFLYKKVRFMAGLKYYIL